MKFPKQNILKTGQTFAGTGLKQAIATFGKDIAAVPVPKAVNQPISHHRPDHYNLDISTESF